MRKVSVIAALLGASAFMGVVSASAGPIEVDADVTVGLDPETRALIQGLPKEIRVQAVTFLLQALPLIDATIADQIVRVRMLIDHTGCMVQGVTEDLLKRILGIRPQPLKKLQTEWEKQPGKFRRDSRRIDYVVAYGDHLAFAAVTACSVPEEVRPTAREFAEQMRPKWLLWTRVGKECDSAVACWDVVSEQVRAFVKAQDPRDVQTAGAEAALQAVRSPETERHFRAAPYEDGMNQLFKIADSVTIAKLGRQHLEASEKLRTATAMLEEVKSWNELADNYRTRQDNRACLRRSRAMLADSDRHLGEAAGLLTAALQTSPAVESQVTAQRSRIPEMMRRTAEVWGNLKAKEDRVRDLDRFVLDAANGRMIPFYVFRDDPKECP